MHALAKRLLWSSLALSCMLGCASCEREHAAALASDTRPLGTMAWHEVAGLRVLEVEVGAHDASLPMVVFIHGRGDVANPGWIEGFDAPARYVFPQAPTPFDDGFSWFTYDADANPKTLAKDIGRAADMLAHALGELASKRPTLGKPIVAGFSQGGMLAYALALLHPESVAFAVPVAGMLPAPLFAQLPVGGQHYPPVRALHGTGDEVVPFAPTASMVEALQKRGLDIKLDKYPGVGHVITDDIRAQMLSFVREALAQNRELAANGGEHAKPTAIP